MTFEQATILRDTFSRLSNEAALSLRSISGVGSGPMGLTPDNVKFSPEYRAAKIAFDCAFRNLQAFNKRYVREYKTELRAQKRAKYG
jgi:hypothetical protein